MRGTRLTTYSDIIRYCYDEKYGWNIQLIIQRLITDPINKWLVYRKAGDSQRWQMFQNFRSTFFGYNPRYLDKYRMITTKYSKQIDVAAKNDKYELTPRGNAYKLRGGFKTDQLLPIGNNYDFTKDRSLQAAINADNTKEIQLDQYNPFQCAEACAKDEQCDMFQQVQNTCKLYDLNDTPAAKSFYAKNTGYLSAKDGKYRRQQLKKEDYDYFAKSEINYRKNWHMIIKPEFVADFKRFSSKNTINLNSWENVISDKKMASLPVDDMTPTNARLVWELNKQKFINDTVSSSKVNQASDVEGFIGSATNKYLDSSNRSLQVAIADAAEIKKTYEFTDSQASYSIYQKIYYNLFTTGLWIINIACLIAILYVIIVGFMGVDVSGTSFDLGLGGSGDVEAPVVEAPVAPAPTVEAPAVNTEIPTTTAVYRQ